MRSGFAVRKYGAPPPALGTGAGLYVVYRGARRELHQVFTRAAIEVILKIIYLGARLRWAARAGMSPRQLKEVIQVAHTNVGSVASLGALVGGEVHC